LWFNFDKAEVRAMQMIIDYASVVYQTYGPPAFVVGGLFAFAILVFIFRRVGVAAYTFPALILLTIFGLVFVPREIFAAIANGQGSEQARAHIAELESMVPARYIAGPILGLTALIFLRGQYMVLVVLLTLGIVYVIEAQLNPTSLASLGLPTVKVPDMDLLNLRNLQLGGGASGLKEGVSGLAGSIPIGK
jgi:hypothetical protein